MDPPNVMQLKDLNRQEEYLEETIVPFAKHIVLAHAKDVLFQNQNRGLPGAGEGQMDYPAYIRTLRKINYDYFLVVEHVSAATVEAARRHVEKAMTS